MALARCIVYLTSGGGWTSMVERNGVNAGDAVQLWTFRRLEEQLWFSLVVLKSLIQIQNE